MPPFSTSELGALAVRVLESEWPNAWFVVVVDRAIDDIVRTLSAEILALGGEEPTVGVVTSGAELEGFVREHAEGIAIVTGASAFTDPDWHRIDVNRTRLQRSGTTVLVLDPPSVEHLENEAPNLASWIGGNIWCLEKARPLDGVLVEQRLVALRQWSGIDDLEIIRLAEAGTLPPDPEYAEWLTLLERGELLAK